MNEEVLHRAVRYIDSWLAFRAPKLDLPGFVVAIAHKGKLILNRGYGYADLESSKKMQADHIFRIASHSKSFTATAIMHLQERSLVDIDRPVATYLAWLNDHPDERFRTVTPRQLLSHTAGVTRDSHDCDFWILEYPFPDADIFQQRTLNERLIFTVNKQMKYSNWGFGLLGLLIEAVSGTSYNAYVRQNIVNPLELADTGPDYDPDVKERLVTGYGRKHADGRVRFSDSIDTGILSSATGFYSTAADLCKFFSNHFVLAPDSILSDKSKEQMQQPHKRINNTKDYEQYGLGLAIDYANGRTLFGHGGSFPGHRTKTMCDASAELVVTVLINCIDGEARSMAKGIYSIIDHFESSNAVAIRTVRDKLRKFEGRFTSYFSDVDIVEWGNCLVGTDPNSWFPFSTDQDLQMLELVDDNTLYIASAHGYSSAGEQVRFHFEGDEVKSIRYGGLTMHPVHSTSELQHSSVSN